MWQKATIFFIIIISAVLQSAVFSNVFFWGLGPNLLLLLVIFWTTQEGFEKALAKNIFAGLIFDLAFFSTVGVHIFSFVSVAFFVSFITKRFFVVARNWQMFILAITIIFSTLANNLFLNGLFLVSDYFGRSGSGSLPIPFFGTLLLKEILLNILFFPLVYYSLKRIERSRFWQVRKKVF